MIPIHKLSGRLGNQMFQFAYIYSQMRDGIIPDVYVQDYEYFDKYREAIRIIYREGVSDEVLPVVAIHVRRGDYVNNSFYVDLCNTNYYKEAMGEFKGQVFKVFSDDIEWCKRQEIFKGCTFSDNQTELADLNEMMSCCGIIMANSTFSWWAAYLSNAKVIAPKAWHPDGVERTKLLSEWKKI